MCTDCAVAGYKMLVFVCKNVIGAVYKMPGYNMPAARRKNVIFALKISILGQTGGLGQFPN